MKTDILEKSLYGAASQTVRDESVSVGMVVVVAIPAVHHHRPGVWRVTGFNPAQEGQEWCGVFGNAMIRPCCELELPHLPLLTTATLQ